MRKNSFCSLTLLKEGKLIFGRRAFLFYASKIGIAIFMIFSISTLTLSQSTNFIPPSVLPPPPIASSINKGGDVSVNLSTGTPNVNIPLFDIKSRFLNLPISLNYTSNGIRVDDLASNVGLGWSLNCGGVITRTILGLPDENDANTGVTNFTLGNYDITNRDQVDFFTDKNRDHESDIFSFSVNGYISGKFILDDQLNPILLTNKNVRIKKLTQFITDGFEITDENGIVYTFSNPEFSYYLNSCEVTDQIPIVNAWQLTSIKKNEQDAIAFEYIDNSYQYLASINETESIVANSPIVMYGCGAAGSYYLCALNSSTYNFCKTTQNVEGKLIDKITFLHGYIQMHYGSFRSDLSGCRQLTGITLYDNDNNVVKDYKFIQDYFISEPGYGSFLSSHNCSIPELLYRLYLREIDVTGQLGTSPVKYNFEYNDGNKLPARLSAAQDYLGFYNGKDNNAYMLVNVESENPGWDYYNTGHPMRYGDRSINVNSMQYGLLTKVTYPTSGSDILEYDYNKYFSSYEVPYFTNYFFSLINSDPESPAIQTNSFSIPFPQQVKLNFSISANVDDPLDDDGTLTIKNSSGQVVYSKTLLLGYNAVVQFPLWLNADTYEIDFLAGVDISVFAGINYQWKQPGVVPTVLPLGGLSISKITSNDPVSNSVNVKQFTYKDITNDQFSSFSIKPPKFTYLNNVTQFMNCSNPDVAGIADCAGTASCLYVVQSNNTIQPLTTLGSNAIYHRSVLESTENADYKNIIAHKFLYNPVNDPDVISGSAIPNAPYDFYPDMLWGEESTLYYGFNKNTNTKTLVKSITNTYKDYHNQVVRNFATLKKYISPCVNPTPTPVEVGSVDVNRYSLNYQNIKLLSSETSIFDEGNHQLTEKINLDYTDNTNYTFLRQTSKTNSKHDIVTDKYKYIFEDPTQLVYPVAILKNQLSDIIEAKTDYNSNTIKADYVGLKYIPSPYVQSADIITTYKVDEQLRNNTIYNLYEATQFDVYGNVIELKKQNNIFEVYLYGYDRSYPIAHIVGADYQTVISKLISSTVEGLQTITDDAVLRSKLNEIRTGLLGTKALVTTYTYKPLVGMTSQTDPSGKTTYYEYDSFGRLKLIRDQDNNIIKKFCYNYAGQPENCN